MTKKSKKRKTKIKGTPERPRLSVFRSGRSIYAQVIDDTQGKTLLSACDKEIKTSKESKKPLSSKSVRAAQVGRLLAKKAIRLKVKKVTFDRGRCLYHGRIKALADGAREGGLEF